MFHALERLFQKLHTLHPTAVGSPAAVSLLKSFTATALLFHQPFFVFSLSRIAFGYPYVPDTCPALGVHAE